MESFINNQAFNKEIEDKNAIEEEINEKIRKVKEKISVISKMDVFQYLIHINGKDEGNEDSESKEDNIEEKMDDLEQLMKKYKEIKYKVKF